MRYLEYALVGEVKQEPGAHHYVGLPPEVGGSEDRERFPLARVVVIEEDADGAVYLYRYDDEGRFAGDTWHRDIGIGT